jgi:hypothetical protein
MSLLGMPQVTAFHEKGRRQDWPDFYGMSRRQVK